MKHLPDMKKRRARVWRGLSHLNNKRSHLFCCPESIFPFYSRRQCRRTLPTAHSSSCGRRRRCRKDRSFQVYQVTHPRPRVGARSFDRSIQLSEKGFLVLAAAGLPPCDLFIPTGEVFGQNREKVLETVVIPSLLTDVVWLVRMGERGEVQAETRVKRNAHTR